jgi:hypothetical protein
MFKISSFEQELMNEMSKQLVANQAENQHSFNKIAKAADYLNAAAEILDDTGLHAQAEVVTELLESLAGQEDDGPVGEENEILEEIVEDIDIEGLVDQLVTHARHISDADLKILETMIHAQLKRRGVKPLEFEKTVIEMPEDESMADDFSKKKV